MSLSTWLRSALWSLGLNHLLFLLGDRFIEKWCFVLIGSSLHA